MRADFEVTLEDLRQEVVQEYGVNPKKKTLPPDVKRWVELIHEHLTSEELTIGWLMEQTHFNEKTARRFRFISGSYPKSYITRLRVVLACKLLDCEAYDITSAALATGFSDRSTLSKAYKKHFGMNLSESLKKKQKKGEDKNSHDFSQNNSRIDIFITFTWR